MNRISRILIATLSLSTAAALMAPAAGAAPAPQYCGVNVETGATACVATWDATTEAHLASAVQADVKLGKVWGKPGYDGRPNATFFASRKCTSAYDDEGIGFAYNLSGALAVLNNEISSLKTFDSRCDIRLSKGFNGTGGSSTWIDQYGNLANLGNGSFNNSASSLRFS